MDSRYQQLAEILTSYSVNLKRGENVWIRVIGLPALKLARYVYAQSLRMGVHPYLDISDESTAPTFFSLASDEHLTAQPKIEEYIAQWSDRIITLVGEENTRALSNSDTHKILLRAKTKRNVRDMVLKKPWTLTYVPTHALAQDAGMSFHEFEDFYFGATNRDWEKEGKRIRKLAKRLNDAKKIEVVGVDTHLTLSAKGRIFVPDCGEANMPGGEVFTAPVDTSVNGHVYFNFPLLRAGKFMRDIRLWFEDGKIVKATASENEDYLTQILDTDEGARRLGEFAIGMNPGITRYMYNVLFDEKIEGTIHMAVGEAYEDCKGINKSHIHMDIVKDMKPSGSRVIVDGAVVLKDGQLVV